MLLTYLVYKIIEIIYATDSSDAEDFAPSLNPLNASLASDSERATFTNTSQDTSACKDS